MQKIKVVSTDLDGTLLTYQKKILPETEKALFECKKNGILVIINTGRTLEGIKTVFPHFAIADYMIINNGGAIYDVEKQTFLYKKLLPYSLVKEIYEEFEKDCSFFDICTINHYYSNQEIIKKAPHISTFVSIESLEKEDICSISMTPLKKEQASFLQEKIEEKYPNIDVLYMKDSFQDKIWLQIVPKKINKKETYLKLLSMLHIDKKDTVFFGDGLNDICVMEVVGYGVAVGNALPEVKEKASYQTGSYEENGVGEWIQEHQDLLI